MPRTFVHATGRVLQRAAVRRMLAMETGGHGACGRGRSSHPFIQRLVTHSGLPIFANMVGGMCLRENLWLPKLP